MSVVELTFGCERLDLHGDAKKREWTAQGQLRLASTLDTELSPFVVSGDAECPECGHLGVADYSDGTVYVLPDDESNRDRVAQIRAAIKEA